MVIDYNGNKAFRLLNMYERLNKGELINKKAASEYFGVSLKTIQRDIDDLRAYIAEEHYSEFDTCIKYSKSKDGYYLVRLQREWFTNREVTALIKILLESRAFSKDELSSLVDKLVTQTTEKDKNVVKEVINKEYFSYIPPRHNKPLLDIIWQLSEIINAQKVISFIYTRQDGKKDLKMVKPVSIMFSEFYFYLIAFVADNSKDYPIVYRIDRIADLKETNERFAIPYKDRFDDGEFRKRVQFMYPGELKKVKFGYTGGLEALLDRLPTAQILEKRNDKYIIVAETYGDGIFMWLKSQGDAVEIID